MKAISGAILALVLIVAGVSQTNSAEKKGASVSDTERLIGAWRLTSMSGPDGRPMTSGCADRHACLHQRRPHVGATHVSQVGGCPVE